MTFPAGSPDPVPAESYEELPQGTPAWINLAAGAFAGIAEHSITFPIDSIKVFALIALLFSYRFFRPGCKY